MTFKFTASNLGYDTCPRTIWLKARGVQFPGGFSSAAIRAMEKTQHERFAKCESISSMCDEFPKGKVVSKNKRPSTLPLPIEGADVIVSGQYNYLVKLANNDPSIEEYAVLGFKTSKPKDENIDALTTQLNAIAYALENNKDHKDRVKVVQLGIVIFDPNAFDAGEDFYQWLSIELNLDKFESDLAEKVKIAMGPCPAYDGCDECTFVSTIETLLFESAPTEPVTA